MVNEKIFRRMIEKRGKDVIIQEIIDGYLNYDIVIHDSLYKDCDKLVYYVGGLIPPILSPFTQQDTNFLKEKGLFDSYFDEVKEYRISFKNSKDKLKYEITFFAKWIVEHPEFSFLFDYVEPSVVHDFDGGYPMRIPKIPREMYEK